MSGVLGMLPGVGKINRRSPRPISMINLKRQHAIITSTTPYEWRNPKALDAKAKRAHCCGLGHPSRGGSQPPRDRMHRQMVDYETMGRNKGNVNRFLGGGAAELRARPKRPLHAGAARQARSQGARAAAQESKDKLSPSVSAAGARVAEIAGARPAPPGSGRRRFWKIPRSPGKEEDRSRSNNP